MWGGTRGKSNGIADCRCESADFGEASKREKTRGHPGVVTIEVMGPMILEASGCGVGCDSFGGSLIHQAPPEKR